MIDHVKLWVSDAEASRRFYEPALEPLGYRVMMEPIPGVIGMGAQMPDFWLAGKEPDQPATTAHVAFRAETRELVDAFYEAAIAAGGTDNGAPGPRRYHPHYYGAFVLDPDGNNVEAVCHAG